MVFFRNDYDESGLPSHSCLRLVANNEQILTKVTSRRLLTFEKIKMPTAYELNSCSYNITDFRQKYYEVRQETRRERREKDAKIREENRKKYNGI